MPGSDVEAPVGVRFRHVHYRNAAYVGFGKARSKTRCYRFRKFRSSLWLLYLDKLMYQRTHEA